jgi:chromate reductase
MSFCNAPLMNAVEAYIQVKPGLLSEDGEVTDEGTAEFLKAYMEEFREFVVRVLTVVPKR